jgi:hypothetical protein
VQLIRAGTPRRELESRRVEKKVERESFDMPKLPYPHDNSNPPDFPTDILCLIFRGQVSLHVAQIDRDIPLQPDSLLRTSWLASELAARLEGRA